MVYLKGDEPAPADLAEGGRSLPLARNLPEPEMRRQLSKILEGEVVAGLPVSTAAEVQIDMIGALRSPQRAEIESAAVRAAPPPPMPTAVPVAARTSMASPAAASGGPLSGRVLLVEDNPVNRQVANRILSLLGLEVDSAENGQEALDKLKTTRYALILMDCQMPVMDGYGAARRRRQIETEAGLPRLPIAAILGHWLAQSPYREAEAARPAAAPSAALSAPAAVPAVAPRAAPTTRSPMPQAATRPAVASATAVAAPAAAASGPALDTEVVEDLREVMGSEFLALIRVFLEDTPRTLQRLQRAAELGDTSTLVSSAHSLKSTSANLGALDLSELARQIEHGGRAGTLDSPQLLVARVVAEFVRVESALRGLLG
jgi:CheY-like chemotaxis protein